MNGKPFSSQYAVHPHIRGAYAALPRQQLIFPGSSPHTWGIPLLGLRMLLPDRFIPTHVGHTQDRAGMSTPRSVHPHIRGAYVVHIRQLFRRDGSSPHTWGIQHAVGRRAVLERFIPTYVGHAYNRTRLYIFNPVHPHIRGAYLSDRQRKACYARFIPTYVGHTYWLIYGASRRPVHPHIRGAYGFHSVQSRVGFGSSPHTWGIRQISG